MLHTSTAAEPECPASKFSRAQTSSKYASNWLGVQVGAYQQGGGVQVRDAVVTGPEPSPEPFLLSSQLIFSAPAWMFSPSCPPEVSRLPGGLAAAAEWTRRTARVAARTLADRDGATRGTAMHPSRR
jgi:hypothetical protein